ncbi:MAG: hypothetical protein J6Z74_00795 [Eubacterium sp.]|jgi:hypothetical protein|nr:hypothetical protein [Eubacterium sp.]
MGRVVLGSIIDKIGEMSKTSELERLLLGIAYWLGVIIVILFVFLVAIKISNFIKERRGTLKREKDDFFL